MYSKPCLVRTPLFSRNIPHWLTQKAVPRRQASSLTMLHVRHMYMYCLLYILCFNDVHTHCPVFRGSPAITGAWQDFTLFNAFGICLDYLDSLHAGRIVIVLQSLIFISLQKVGYNVLHFSCFICFPSHRVTGVNNTSNIIYICK